MARRRQAWFDGQPELDPERLIFIDESGASTKMARLRGRARRGERCRAAVPHGHWKTTTFVGALRLRGMTAPMVLDGPMNGPAFLAYVEQVLVPTLAPGETVIMDNLLPTRWRACAPPSRRPGQVCACCRPIVPTSTRSSWPSPNSRPGCDVGPHAPSPRSGTPSPQPCRPSRQQSAPITSPPAGTNRNERNLL